MGQALAEFALLVPVMLLMMLLTIDFGRIFFTTIQVSNAVREAANYGGSNPVDTTGMVARANAERNSQTQTGQQDVLTYPANLSTSCATPGGTSIPCADSPGGGGAGNTLTVSLNAPFQFITPLINDFFGGSLTIRSSATVTVMGFVADPNDTNPDGCSPPDTPMLTVTATDLTVVLDPAGSLPDSGVCAISGYNYDFGDGQNGVGGTVPTNHTYGSADAYTITLRVTNQGGSNSATQTVTVPPPTPSPSPMASPTGIPTSSPSTSPTPTSTPIPTPTPFQCSAPTAAFTFTTSSRGSGGHADFTDQSTYAVGCPITSWLWDFGDGTPVSNAQNPSHDFADKNHTYTVTLTVTNSAGSRSISHGVKPK